MKKTRTATTAVIAALLAATATACGTDEAGPRDDGDPTASAAPAEHLDRVGSILPGEGWTIVDAYDVGETEGEYEVNDPSGGEVTITWRAADDYPEYVDDRADVSRAEQVEVLGADGRLYTYSDHDFTVLRAVDGASFIELRATFVSRAELDTFLAGLREAGEEEFASALDDAGVQP